MSARDADALRLLRRHRRPRVQEDLPRAAAPWSATARLDVPVDRRRASRLERRRTSAPAPGESLEEHGGVRRGGVRQARRRCCATSTATTRDPTTVRAARAGSSATRSGRCTTWRSRRALFATRGRGPGASGCAEGARVVRREAVRPRPRLGARRSTASLHERCSPRTLIFRIDHYLGKEPVQNLLYIRFANSVPRADLEPHTTSRSVQITMAEAFGVEGRGRLLRRDRRDPRRACRTTCCRSLATLAHGRADRSGARRRPRRRRRGCSRAIRPLAPEDVVRGQYRGYRDDPGVAPDSAGRDLRRRCACSIDSWRWAGVPFFIRAGKMLPVTATEVLVEFKRPAAGDVRRDRPAVLQPPALPPQSRRPHRHGCPRQDARRAHDRLGRRAAAHPADERRPAPVRAPPGRCHEGRRRRCSRARTPSRRSGRWSMRCSATGRLCMPTHRATGAPTRRSSSSGRTGRGTTRQHRRRRERRPAGRQRRDPVRHRRHAARQRSMTWRAPSLVLAARLSLRGAPASRSGPTSSSSTPATCSTTPSWNISPIRFEEQPRRARPGSSTGSRRAAPVD